MKSKELAQLGKEDLAAKLKQAEIELIKINVQVATGTQIKNPGQIRNLKKTIARIKSLTDKEVSGQ
ncbi:50S ribosomal protein L29 [Candidatus Woesearchaeota archaeon]|nr:MAG: hypothetical protein QS99_C0002G0030 [archaeon GW2011_AR4]MBS3129185.1 50S ribosomal protein L29 [Candidatus Woesearchaeota archaeon]HIH37918.1 50S ribosomal protein L29 [Candidatus Woesearchaeota archaeon]HIH48873.1 50S ribosomal protein L29 [Candidatus Woesearchaeota archaeon]HIJ04045.1 50S ribosomal protein L29 [Candidatus Woesearchaeota archaeon]